MKDSQKNIDTILLHELAHCIINSGNDTKAKSEALEKLGQYFYGYSNPATEDYTQHTEQFFMLLAEGCANYQRHFPVFNSPEEVIKSAMRFDIEGYN